MEKETQNQVNRGQSCDSLLTVLWRPEDSLTAIHSANICMDFQVAAVVLGTRDTVLDTMMQILFSRGF